MDNQVGASELLDCLDKELNERDLFGIDLNPERCDVYKQYFEQLIQSMDDLDGYSDVSTLLSRAKDELTMTADSYKKLYGSSVTFGVQKALHARHEIDNLIMRNEALEKDNRNIKEENIFLHRKVSVLEEKLTSLKANSKVHKCKQEVMRMRQTNKAITRHLENCLVESHNEVCNALER